MKIKLLLSCLIVALGCTLVAPVAARADSNNATVDTGCDADDSPSYTGTLSVPDGTYDAYARLSKRGEQATVRAYAQTASGEYGICQKLGEVAASGDSWTKLGELTAAGDKEYTLQLSSIALGGLPDANRPAILLVPHDNPICVPRIECELTVNGQAGFVRPTGTLLNEDSLHVLLVTNPDASTIAGVRYYVDNKLAYETSQLKPFDLRYVSYPKQKLARAVIYTSGQQIILPGEVPSNYQDSFGNLMFRLGKQYPNIITIALVLLGVILLLSSILAITHAVWHHRNWQYNHGIARKTAHQLTNGEKILLQKREGIIRISKLTLLGTGITTVTIASILLANTYLAQIFTVDGRSMRDTMFTGEKVLINKIPSSLASLNNREYIPNRGDVVVARAVFGAVGLDTDTSSQIYIIKRVIGLPGERIVVKDGTLTVYNKEHPDGFQPDKGSHWEHTMVPNERTEQLDVQLSQSELFLSGDNRPESIDSRFNGPITTNEIVGRASKIWPPFGHSHPADE